MAGRCFCSYLPAPFHSKSYSNLIHMVEMDRSFLCVHWNINRDVKFEFLLHELNFIVFFSLRKNNRNDTIHDRQSFSYWVLHFSTTTPNWKMQITRVTHCHAGYQASFFKAPKKLNHKKTSPSLALAEQRGKQNRYLVSARCVVCFQFSVLLERNKI